MKTMYVVVVEPGQQCPEIRIIDTSTFNAQLSALQTCVGGSIEVIHCRGDYTMYANEEGTLYQMERNPGASRNVDLDRYPDGVVGPVVLWKKEGLTERECKDIVLDFMP